MPYFWSTDFKNVSKITLLVKPNFQKLKFSTLINHTKILSKYATYDLLPYTR